LVLQHRRPQVLWSLVYVLKTRAQDIEDDDEDDNDDDDDDDDDYNNSGKENCVDSI